MITLQLALLFISTFASSNLQNLQVKRVISEDMKQAKILAYITALKKLCNHPKV